jgi:hypothetical protein
MDHVDHGRKNREDLQRMIDQTVIAFGVKRSTDLRVRRRWRSACPWRC